MDAVLHEPTSTVPMRCVERHPTVRTVWFAGVPITMAELSRSFDPHLDQSYLSHIFAGRRTPSVDVCERLALGLGMQLQAFLTELRRIRLS